MDRLTREQVMEIESKISKCLKICSICSDGCVWHVFKTILLLINEIERLEKENKELIENTICGCGVCLAHNNMKCPKTPKTSNGPQQDFVTTAYSK